MCLLPGHTHLTRTCHPSWCSGGRIPPRFNSAYACAGLPTYGAEMATHAATSYQATSPYRFFAPTLLEGFATGSRGFFVWFVVKLRCSLYLEANRPHTPASLCQECAVCHGGSERLSLRLIWPTAKHRPIQHDGSGQSPLCTFGTIYCRFQDPLPGNLVYSLLRRGSGRRQYICRMSTREAHCPCPSAHVTGCIGELVFELQRPLSARCRNACIFASPGLDTKSVLRGPTNVYRLAEWKWTIKH